MKLKLSAQILSVAAIAITSTSAISQPSYGQTQKFFCGMSRGVPATFVTTARGQIPIIKWTNGFGDRWTPHNRCEAISDRFNSFYQNGTLKYIRAGSLNTQPVLCVANYRGGPCLKDGVLVTLKQGTNPHSVLYNLLNKSASAGGRVVELSNPISTVRGNTYLDMEKLIGEKPTGNAKQCQGPVWEDC
jgi:hypothetical protein